MRTKLKDILELSKVRISFSVALSALTGYVLYTGILDGTAWAITAGVFFYVV